MICEQSKVSADLSGYKRQNNLGPTTTSINDRKTFTPMGLLFRVILIFTCTAINKLICLPADTVSLTNWQGILTEDFPSAKAKNEECKKMGR